MNVVYARALQVRQAGHGAVGSSLLGFGLRHLVGCQVELRLFFEDRLSRTRSSLCILNFRRAHHLFAEMAGQILRGTQIDLAPAEQGGELLPHRRDAE